MGKGELLFTFSEYSDLFIVCSVGELLDWV